jgi:hypothetical protein
MITRRIRLARQSVSPLIAALALALAACLAAQAQTTREAPGPQTQESPRQPPIATPARPEASDVARPQAASRERLLELLRAATPSWNESVLQIPDFRNWASQLSAERVAETLEDRELAAVIRRAPTGVHLYRTTGSVLRFNPERGELRYVNHGRAVDFRSEIGKLPSEEEAQQLALRALTALGLPRDQFRDLKVATQMAGGGPAGSRQMEVRSAIYRLVTVNRRLGELPVLVSGARVAVNPYGQIHRLRMNWPPLSLGKRKRVVETATVLDRAVQVLLDQDVSASAEVRGRLSYVPRDDRDTTAIVPAVHYTVLDPPTPFMFSVPVAEAAEGDDD